MPANSAAPRVIWFNGQLVPWASATVHVMTHALHYGAAVFEGIRCYDTPRGPAIFRGRAHVRRMRDSARVYRMELPLSESQLLDVCRSVVRVNGLRSAYVRPLGHSSGALTTATKRSSAGSMPASP